MVWREDPPGAGGRVEARGWSGGRHPFFSLYILSPHILEVRAPPPPTHGTWRSLLGSNNIPPLPTLQYILLSVAMREIELEAKIDITCDLLKWKYSFCGETKLLYACNALRMCCAEIRGSQRDLSWLTNSALIYEPKCAELLNAKEIIIRGDISLILV